MSSYLLFNTYTNTKRIFHSSHNSLSFSCICHEMGSLWSAVWILVQCHIIFFQRHSFLFLPLFRTLLPADETAVESSQFWSPLLLYLCTYRAHKLSFLLVCFLLEADLHTTWRRIIWSRGSANTFLPHLPDAQNKNNSICGITSTKMLLNCKHFFSCDWR